MNQEYEVESIIQARVEQKRGKKKDLLWKYRVRWRGYSPDDDTWEPAGSFVDSEHIIERFWERATAGGRDYRDLSLFSVGEEFVPTGPPRRGVKRKSSATVISSAQPTPNTNAIKNSEAAPSASNSQSTSNIARADDLDNDRPLKRAREAASSSKLAPVAKPRSPMRATHEIISQPNTPLSQPKRKTRATSFDEIIPASDEEPDEHTGNIHRSASLLNSESPSRGDLRIHHLVSTEETASNIEMTQNHSLVSDVSDSLVNLAGQNTTVAMPFHRAKATDPKVKTIDDHNLARVEKGIPTKARLRGTNSKRNTTPQTQPPDPASLSKSTSKTKPGPGRSSAGLLKNNVSSLLTFEKGKLKTVKGRFVKEKHEMGNEASSSPHGSLWGDDDKPGEDVSSLSLHPDIQPTPTADELLTLAGTNMDKDVLSDFEDVTPAIVGKPLNPESNTPDESTPLPTTGTQSEEIQATSQQSSLELAKDKLFPTGASTAAPDTLNRAWKQSTIFGPMGFGSYAHTKSEPTAVQSAQPSSFHLHLDTSATIPVIIADSPSSSSAFDFLDGNTGPPGKFYSPNSALALLDTVRTGGTSATIDPDANSTPNHKSQFELFRSRLNSGEMFVAMAGVEVLAFCSSDNALLSQRLNIPPSLLGQPGRILLTRVVIENYSAYAEAALDADGRRWLWSADSAVV